MTKVEELLKELLRKMAIHKMDTMMNRHLVDDIIREARSEGVAEGAEQERERIREASSYMAEGTQADCDSLYIHKEYHNGQEYHVILVGSDFYMVDPTNLVPKTEVKRHATESELMAAGMCTAEDLKAMALEDASVLAPTKESEK